MEQYFAKQSNCCQLSFSNKLAPKHIISPLKFNHQPKLPVNKSSKKSLKALPSHQSLTHSKNHPNHRKSIDFDYSKPDSIKKDHQFNDYHQEDQKQQKIAKSHHKNPDHKKQILNSPTIHNSPTNYNSPSVHKLKQAKSLERNQPPHSPNKLNSIQDMRTFRFSQKPNLAKLQRDQPPRASVVVTTIINPPQTHRPQPLFTQTMPYFYKESMSPYHNQHYGSHTSPQFYQVPNFGQSPPKQYSFRQSFASTPFQISQKNISKIPVLKKQSTTNYTENFKKIYGEVEIEDEIKRDLMLSLQGKNKLQNDNHHQYNSQNQNAVSMLTKCPPSQESTILPADSKLRTKVQYQIDSFAQPVPNHDKRSGTEKFLKAQFLMSGKPQSMRISGRQKFKSIVSVESEHSSSSSEIDSVIIDKHPQHLLSSNPIKSLL